MMDDSRLAIYPLSDNQEKFLDSTFRYHTPRADNLQALRHEAVRSLCGEVARDLCSLCPPSRELSLALTSLQQTMMWANAAISITESPPR